MPSSKNFVEGPELLDLRINIRIMMFECLTRPFLNNQNNCTNVCISNVFPPHPYFSCVAGIKAHSRTALLNRQKIELSTDWFAVHVSDYF